MTHDTVVYQRDVGEVGCLTIPLLQIYYRVLLRKNILKLLNIWQSYGEKLMASSTPVSQGSVLPKDAWNLTYGRQELLQQNTVNTAQ